MIAVVESEHQRDIDAVRRAWAEFGEADQIRDAKAEVLGVALRKLRSKFKARGVRNNIVPDGTTLGFRSVLKQIGIPKTTAHRLIEESELQEQAVAELTALRLRIRKLNQDTIALLLLFSDELLNEKIEHPFNAMFVKPVLTYRDWLTDLQTKEHEECV